MLVAHCRMWYILGVYGTCIYPGYVIYGQCMYCMTMVHFKCILPLYVLCNCKIGVVGYIDVVALLYAMIQHCMYTILIGTSIVLLTYARVIVYTIHLPKGNCTVVYMYARMIVLYYTCTLGSY
jgi:hypothetical protein